MASARALIFIVACLASAGGSAAGDSAALSDAALLAYASGDYDKALYESPPVVLGAINGTTVMVEHICSDLYRWRCF
jgi:hypothetical protein